MSSVESRPKAYLFLTPLLDSKRIQNLIRKGVISKELNSDRLKGHKVLKLTTQMRLMARLVGKENDDGGEGLDFCKF